MRDSVARVIDALAEGTRAALADRDATVEDLVEASGADEPLVRAQLDAVAPALRPPMRFDREALRAWARFDVRFGILERRPDVDAAFDVGPDRSASIRPLASSAQGHPHCARRAGAPKRGAQPSSSSASTRAGPSRAMRDRGTTRVTPAASASRRTSCSTWE
jgi:hypothetical protein